MIDVLQPLKIGYCHTSRIQIQVLHGHNKKNISAQTMPLVQILITINKHKSELHDPNLLQIALAVFVVNLLE